MGLMSAALRRHGTVYMADPLYRTAWFVWPLMVALFFVSRLVLPVHGGRPVSNVAAQVKGTVAGAAAPIDRAKPPTPRVASTLELYQLAKIDDREAEHALRQKANEGSALAQNAMGNLYDPLLNKAKANASRTIEAIDWYRRAAKQGALNAERNLGLLLSGTFFGIPPNETEARRWLGAIAPIDITADRQLAWLCLNGRGCDTDVSAAYRLLQAAADRGDIFSENWLGAQYETGSNGIVKNPVEAVRLFQLAAIQGNAMAERKFATHLANGDGVSADAKEARRWYALAAAAGDTKAQARLIQIDPLSQFQTPKWGAGTRPIAIAVGHDVRAERERCIAFRMRETPDKMASNLPMSFDQQKQQSERLLLQTPRDPRVRYARAAALYDTDQPDLARVHLECAVDDQVTLARYPTVAPYIFALLARIDVDQNDRVDAEKTIAPVCVSNVPGIRKLDDDIGLCR